MIVKFMSFSLVGAIGTLAHYSILYALVESNGFNPVWASGWGALAGLIINYVLNYSLTFKSRQSHVQTFPKFALIASFGWCLNMALMTLLTQHLYYLYAQVVATIAILVWNFFANSFWTFQADVPLSAVADKPVPSIQTAFTGFGLLTIILATRVLTLGLYPLYDPSESRYAEMGRKMLETGNWITPMFDYGVPFWGKPPLTVWMTASSLWLGGINDFSARLPSFLLSLGIVWIIFHLVCVQRSRDNAWNAVLMLASSVLYFVMSGTVAMDVCMSFGITLALASFWLALRENKSFWAYLFFIGLSVGVMAKGPIAIVLSGISIGLWTAISGQWIKVWKSLPWFKGTLLMVCISIPWFLIAEHKTPGFLEYFLIGEHWKRFTESGWTGDLYGNGHAHTRGMIWVYWLGAAFPWSLVFLKIVMTALVKKKPAELLQTDDGWRLYCLLWMVSPLFFFTFSANIIWTYVLPGLPGFALLLSDWLKRPKYRPIFALCVPLSFLGLVVAYQCPNVDFFRSQKHLVTTYQQLSHPDERLIYFMERPYSAQFYLHGKALEVGDIAALQNSITNSSHDFYVVKQEVLSSLPEAVKLRLELVKNYKRVSLFHAGDVDRK
ncbi:MAG TPA: phospholipid carrier-dependent glycosyltransferase [Methylobacter sp.]|jgi:putative flippase GtrA